MTKGREESERYRRVTADLQRYYDDEAAERAQDASYPGWKAQERERFLRLLQAEGKRSLLEIGSGPGRDALFFQQQGLDVVCTDLSPAMVRYCRAKGLAARVMDFLHLDFPAQSFDAVHALNCLLHVPTADLPGVLRSIQTVLRSGGLFYLGVYGGIEREGTSPTDPHERAGVRRYFSYHTDELMRELVSPWFAIVSFTAIPIEREPDDHFQSLILRRP
jgi:SAM-dependent methyltransferase